MNLIEQATRRLEELRRSGVEISPVTARHRAQDSSTDVDSPRVTGLRRVGPSQQQETTANATSHHPRRTDTLQTTGDSAGKQSRLVELGLERLSLMGYVTPNRPRTKIADEFRVIKRPLLKNVDGKSAASIKRANLILVTSSLPGEGKTFVAINLAISMAMELDHTVMLVDADVSRPSVLERLQLPPSPGLLDVLTDPAIDVADGLMRTNIDRLSILSAGTPNGRATELLASEQMDRLLDDLAGRYADRILVIDAPPLLPSTEARVLATGAGQVILVVEAERTPQYAVEQAMAALEACPVVLPLLNKTKGSEVGAYHGYYGPIDE